MKIGLVCPYDFFRHGAVQKLITLLDEELTLRGHDIRIITPRPRNYKGPLPERTIFVGQSAKWNTPLKTTLEVGMSLETTEMEEMLELEDFDIIHVHEPEIPLLGAQIASRSICPVIATFHATMPETLMAKTVELLRIPYARSIFRNLAAMTAVSESAARFVREWSELPVTIVPNYIDLELYNSLESIKRSNNTILYIGRLEKRKGVKYLLKAFAELSEHDSQVELIIAGDGSERERLENWVEAHQVPRIKFLGAITEAEKMKLLHEAAVFCSPAIYGESFGVVLLEAMAAGAPIVAGDNPGYACVMLDRGLLSLVNPKDTGDFARRLELFLHDEGVRKTWLAWAKKYIKQFDSKPVIDQYENVYKFVVTEKQGQKA
ncbi:glycosyltransferase family 4 protein [Candidatus Saccharibacteria bacterium]|nr:glycosyltransferase family 4 protein [Candidatus Saccharibacteria bacterium]